MARSLPKRLVRAAADKAAGWETQVAVAMAAVRAAERAAATARVAETAEAAMVVALGVGLGRACDPVRRWSLPSDN